MNTPICDFVDDYLKKAPTRLHMPGHKGQGTLEARDLTEISGADDLYHPTGIIKESEENATRLFGCPTFYSTEGSSLCIRAMLRLAMDITGSNRILAGRNAHKVFAHTAALLDLDISWLYGEDYLSLSITPEYLEAEIQKTTPAAVYLTTPDYLGNVLDISQIAKVCHQYGALLLVDNAHGAYLRFLDRHPIAQGADLCCDSAHKTLPVLTGGAYLHLAPKWADVSGSVKDAMALFGSTSPSYLILQSLDKCNAYLETYPQRLAQFLPKMEALKSSVADLGYSITGDEPMKLCIVPKAYGYTGEELAERLEAHDIYPEFADPDNLVLMFTPENTEEDLYRLLSVLTHLPRRAPILDAPPTACRPERVLSIRQAAFAPRELVPLNEALGRVLAAPTVSCPPAIPVVICGERIDESAIAQMSYYGIEHCLVVKE